MSLKLPIFHNQPSIIKADFHINTPMFASGSQQSQAELTPTAFKGVLRFWWRALNWSKIFLANKNNNQQALIALHKQEGELFGLSASAGKEKDKEQERQQGQGKCLININQPRKFIDSKSQKARTVFGVNICKKFNPKSQKKEDSFEINQRGLGYLLGQGLYSDGWIADSRKGLSRNFLEYEQCFHVELTVSAEYHEKIIDVLQVIGLLGGFGSRSRHGFGSVTLTDISQKKIGKDNEFISLNIEVSNAVETLQAILNKYNCRSNTQLPPLSAFYAGTRIDVVPFNRPDALSLLNEVGEEVQMYRSWGRNGKVNGKNAEQNFKQDHDFIINMIADKENDVTHPKRTVFGLPHNYFYSGTDTRGHSGGVDATTGRRASPLFQHIHKAEQGYQLIHCLLQSEFLPDNSIEIQAKLGREKKNIIVNPDVDWTVITNFMNRDKFANKTTLN